MKKVILSFYCLMLSTSAFAGTSDIVASNNLFGVQYRSTNVNYTEVGNGIFGTQTGVLDTETGPVGGFGLTLSSMTGPGHAYVHGEFDLATGSTTYTGAFQGGAFGSVVGMSSATLTDYSLRFGAGYALHEQFMLTPYLELGHHKWNRGVNFGETYTHYYYGIGLLGQYSPANLVVLSANAMVGRTVAPYIDVTSGPGFNGFAGSLGSSALSRIGLAADRAFTPNIHGTIGIDYTSFKYGMSAIFPVGGGFVAWEPDSTTHYTTVKIGLGFAF